MSSFRVASLILLFGPLCAGAESVLDAVDDALTWANGDGSLRWRLSGTLDMEAYHVSGPPPTLLFSDQSDLLNPRLSLFADVQAGAALYGFAQMRLDRGFDPQDGNMELRLDEYAVRWTPWSDGRLSLQAGQFATVVGNWNARHLSWDNPFITAPGPYSTMTPVSEESLYNPAEEHSDLSEDAYEYNPIVWGPSYATGVALSGRLGRFDYAAEWKNASLASRPESWTLRDIRADRGTFSGRLGWRPDESWNLGLSASDGVYMSSLVNDELPQGLSLSDFRQTVIAHDLSYAWRHFQLWAEVFASRFDIPGVGHGDVLGWYVEAKYKFSHRWFGALRFNHQAYGELADADGRLPWGEDSWRAEAAVTCRLSAHSQIKLQYSFQHPLTGDGPDGHLLGAQFTLRF